MVVKIKFNENAFREIRTSPKVLRDLERRAKAIADGCGPDFESSSPATVTGGRGRGRAAVWPTTLRAMRRNARDNTILKNLDKGRG